MDIAGALSFDNTMYILKGFGVTLLIAFIAIVLSFIIGVIIGTLRFAKIPVVSQVLTVLVEIIRNLPLLLILIFTALALPQIGIDLGIFLSAIVALTVFEAAMISEIVRSGLNSVPKGQMEAGRSTGLTYTQTLLIVVMPQALRKMIPPLVSQFISMLKDTSLAVAIALPEMMHNIGEVNGQNANYMFVTYILAALLYFAVNYSLSLVARNLETRKAF